MLDRLSKALAKLQIPLAHAAAKMGVVAMGFTTAAAIKIQRDELCVISTGCKDLDSILEGRDDEGLQVCFSILF